MNDTPNNYHQTKITVNSKQTINETLNDMEKSWNEKEEKVNSIFIFLFFDKEIGHLHGLGKLEDYKYFWNIFITELPKFLEIRFSYL